MNFVDLLKENALEQARNSIIESLNAKLEQVLSEAKEYMKMELFEEVEIDSEELNEAVKRNINIVKMGRVQRVRRRIRRDPKGKIVIQKNRRRSSLKGYRIVGKRGIVRRIPAIARLQKERKMKRAWKTTRRAKLRRSLLKRKISLRRRKAIGL